MDSSLVRQAADNKLELGLLWLAKYVKYAPISCDAAHSKNVSDLAECIAADLKSLGLDAVRVLTLEKAHPCVVAEWKKKPSAPTLLIYGHYDVQPVKGEVWDSPPHELVRKGDRVFARGSADDMGGWVSHLVAISAWLEKSQGLPCNIKLLLEGEEEIGSPNLERFMDAFPEAFSADAMILTDCENPSVDIPGLTISLRGIMELEAGIETAEADVHSGLWGNVSPDPAMLLIKALSRLVDHDGRLCVGRKAIDPVWLRASRDVPLNRQTISEGAHLRAGVEPLADRDLSPAAWAWREPAVTILSTTLPTPGNEKNAIRKSASAILSIRIAPGQTKEELGRVIRETLEKDLPTGITLRITEKPGGASSWDYSPSGPAFDAADRAYEKSWGRKMLPIGVGGSIPFVALFGRRFGKLPLILNGVIDPATTAHGPNESMHVGVFKKAIAANVFLYEELAGALRTPTKA